MENGNEIMEGIYLVAVMGGLFLSVILLGYFLVYSLIKSENQSRCKQQGASSTFFGGDSDGDSHSSDCGGSDGGSGGE